MCAALVLVGLLLPFAARTDEPYARSRDYDLQNIRTHLWFDLDNRKIRGEAAETVSALRDDCVAIAIRFGGPEYRKRVRGRSSSEIFDH